MRSNQLTLKTQLKSLSTGFVALAEDCLNCNATKNVGEKNQASFSGIYSWKASRKRNS